MLDGGLYILHIHTFINMYLSFIVNVILKWPHGVVDFVLKHQYVRTYMYEVWSKITIIFKFRELYYV